MHRTVVLNPRCQTTPGKIQKSKHNKNKPHYFSNLKTKWNIQLHPIIIIWPVNKHPSIHTIKQTAVGLTRRPSFAFPPQFADLSREQRLVFLRVRSWLRLNISACHLSRRWETTPAFFLPVKLSLALNIYCDRQHAVWSFPPAAWHVWLLTRCKTWISVMQMSAWSYSNMKNSHNAQWVSSSSWPSTRAVAVE